MELQLQVDSITAVKCCMVVAFENTQIEGKVMVRCYQFGLTIKSTFHMETLE